jgi:outer membrane receptor protein involved in Fe transport
MISKRFPFSVCKPALKKTRGAFSDGRDWSADRFRCAVMAGGLILASSALAQDAAPVTTAPPVNASPVSQDLKDLSIEDLMRLRVDSVTTASKREEKAAVAPGTAIVVGRNDIKLRGYSTLKDVLKDLPGMEVSEFFFSELGSQVGVRGIKSNNKIVVLVNGMRVNPPGGEYFPLRSDFSVRNAEQIEVIYGPGSTLYGQDAISAVINVKTQMPVEGPAVFEGGVEGGFHAEREAWVSFGKVFDAADNIAFSAFFQYHDSELTNLAREYPAWWEDYRSVADPKGGTADHERRDFGLNGFARLDVGDFSLQSWYRDSERSSGEGYGPPVLFLLPEAVWRDRSWVTEAKHNWHINDRVTLTSSVTYNMFEVDPVSRYVFPASETEWFLNDYKYANGNSLAIEESVRWDIRDDLSLLGGVTYTTYDIIPKATIPGGADPGSDGSILSQGGSFVYYTEAGNPDSIQTIPRVVEVDFYRYGAYLELGWQINPVLKVVAGGRVDKDSRIEDPSYTPRGAVIYNVTDHFTAKYTYSWAYISPAPYFGFATYDRGDILNTSNPNLQPETSKTHEVSFVYDKDPLSLGLSLYYGEQSNLILVSDVGSGPNILSDIVYIDAEGTESRTLTNTVNSGTSKNVGADLFGKAKINRSLSSWFSYSYTTFESKTAGAVSGLEGLSTHNFRLGITWAITPKLFFTPSLIARSTPRNVDAGPLGTELDTPYEINAHLLYKHSSNVEFYADLRNATNAHNALGGFIPYAIPQEGFSGVLGVRVRF